MTVRYSGRLKISCVYDDRGFYRCAVSEGGRVDWRGHIRPAAAGFGRGIAYDSPKAYDEIARSALSHASHDTRGGTDGEVEFDGDGYYRIRRVPRFHEQYPIGSSRKPTRWATRSATRPKKRRARKSAHGRRRR